MEEQVELSIGQRCLDMIISGGLLRVECQHGKPLIVWSANAVEQLDALIGDYVAEVVEAEFNQFSETVEDELNYREWNFIGDQIHDVAAGYGRLVFPWFGKWLMWDAGNRSLRWTHGMQFHNCTATRRL